MRDQTWFTRRATVDWSSALKALRQNQLQRNFYLLMVLKSVLHGSELITVTPKHTRMWTQDDGGGSSLVSVSRLHKWTSFPRIFHWIISYEWVAGMCDARCVSVVCVNSYYRRWLSAGAAGATIICSPQTEEVVTVTEAALHFETMQEKRKQHHSVLPPLSLFLSIITIRYFWRSILEVVIKLKWFLWFLLLIYAKKILKMYKKLLSMHSPKLQRWLKMLARHKNVFAKSLKVLKFF